MATVTQQYYATSYHYADPYAVPYPGAQPSKKRQPFNQPRHASTKAIIDRNATRSRLLRLPREIRDKIFGYVLGDQVIHICSTDGYSLHPTTRSNLRVFVCQSDLCPRQEYHDSKFTPPPQPDRRNARDYTRWRQKYISRHRHCERHMEMLNTGLQPHHMSRSYRYPQPIDLSILRVCHQTYLEASTIFWTSNTFSFLGAAAGWQSGASAFMQWLYDRTTLQKQLVRSIHISLLFNDYDPHWHKLSTSDKLRGLKSLRALHIDIEQGNLPAPQQDQNSAQRAAILDKSVTELMRFGMLPLKEVTVRVANSRHGPNPAVPYAEDWTFDQCRWWAECLRYRLLHPVPR